MLANEIHRKSFHDKCHIAIDGKSPHTFLKSREKLLGIWGHVMEEIMQIVGIIGLQEFLKFSWGKGFVFLWRILSAGVTSFCSKKSKESIANVIEVRAQNSINLTVENLFTKNSYQPILENNKLKSIEKEPFSKYVEVLNMVHLGIQNDKHEVVQSGDFDRARDYLKAWKKD